MNELELRNGVERCTGATASTCLATGVYQSRCGCTVRTAFLAGDPFTACPECDDSVEWQLLGGARGA
jgi:hypothetical protein